MPSSPLSATKRACYRASSSCHCEKKVLPLVTKVDGQSSTVSGTGHTFVEGSTVEFTLLLTTPLIVPRSGLYRLSANVNGVVVGLPFPSDPPLGVRVQVVARVNGVLVTTLAPEVSIFVLGEAQPFLTGLVLSPNLVTLSPKDVVTVGLRVTILPETTPPLPFTVRVLPTSRVTLTLAR